MNKVRFRRTACNELGDSNAIKTTDNIFEVNYPYCALFSGAYVFVYRVKMLCEQSVYL